MTHTPLEYKLADKEGQLIKIDRFYPSSKTCSSCGDEKPKPLNIRTYDCSCVLVLDGDVNAALNIRKKAIEKLKLNRGMIKLKLSGKSCNLLVMIEYGIVEKSNGKWNLITTPTKERKMTTDENKEILEQLITSINPKTWPKFVKKRPDFLKWLNDQTPYKTNNISELVFLVKNPKESPICENGKKRKFKSFGLGYAFCGRTKLCQCARNQISQAVSKAKNNCSDEQKKQIQQKRERTNFEKYGVCNQGQRSETRQKQKAIYQDKIKVQEIAHKIKNTIKTKYGNEVEFYKIRNEKSKQTNLKKYGVENPQQNNEVKEKTKKTRKQNYVPELVWENNYHKLCDKMSNIHQIQILTPKTEYFGLRFRPIMGFKCLKCGNEWEQRFDHANFPRCRTCEPSVVCYKSKEEIEILTFIKELGFLVEGGNRTLIPPYEVDIVIPEKRIAIEYCGLYWHSENSSGKGYFYHKRKWQMLKEKNYQLLTVFSDEWEQKQNVVKSLIKRKLGVFDNVTYARNTNVVFPNNFVGKQFFDQFHILGSYKKANVLVGLESSNKQLLACGSFSKIDDQTYELVRYATSCTVLGGASKIISHFVRKYPNVKKIVSFSDNRFSDGNMYEKLGFCKVGEVPPMQYYVYAYQTRYHKLKFEKKKLVAMGHDKTQTEWQIMQSLGYDRIWDCGKIKWQMEFDNNINKREKNDN